VIVTIDRDSQGDFTDLLFELRLRYLVGTSPTAVSGRPTRAITWR